MDNEITTLINKFNKEIEKFSENLRYYLVKNA